MNIDLIVPAEVIPSGQKVKKLAGQKEYTIQSELVIYGDRTKGLTNRTVKLEDGGRLLVSGTGVNMVRRDQRLVWSLNIRDAQSVINGLVEILNAGGDVEEWRRSKEEMGL